MVRHFNHILVILIFLFAARTYAQRVPFYTKNYTTKDGLIHNNVYHILQDKKGYIWFTTEGGLSRFDGRKFENITTKDGISGNEVFDSYDEEIDNRLWFNSFYSIFYYQTDSMTFSSATLNNKFKFGQNRCVDLIDSKNRIWIQKTSNYIKDKSFELHSVHTTDKLYPNKIFETTKNEIYAFTGNEQMTRLDFFDEKRDSFITRFRFDKDYISHSMGRNLLFCKASNKLYFSNKEGIYSYNLDGKQPELILPSTAYEKSDINHFFIDTLANNTIALVLSTSKNAYFFDFKTKQLLIKTNLGYPIFRIFKDFEKNYWIATQNGGIFYYNNFAINHFNQDKGALIDNNYKFLCANTEGALVALNFNKEITIWDKNGHKTNTFKLDVESSMVRDIVLKDKSILVIISRETLYEYDFKGNSMTQKSKVIKSQTELHNYKKFLITKNEEDIYIPDRTILDRWQPKTSRFRQYQIPLNINFSNVYALSEEETGRICLGGVTGVFFFDPHLAVQTDTFKKLDFDFQKANVLDLISLPNGFLVVATNGKGVFLFKNEVLIQHWTAQNGLKSDNCTKLFYENHTLWILSNKGINCVQFDASNFEKFKFSPLYNHLSFSTTINDFMVKNGRIYVATCEGIYHFLPSELQPYTEAPRFEILTNIAKRDTFFQSKANEGIEFFLKGIAFKNGEHLEYQYFILKKGFNNFYVLEDTIHTSQAVLSARVFDEGRYLLKARCRRIGLDEKWSEWATISFQIIVPWYRNNLAKLVYLCLIFGLGYWIIIRFTKRNRRLNLEKEREKLELEHQALRAQMNPHFIFNSLGTVEKFFLQSNMNEGLDYLAEMAVLFRKMLENSKKSLIPLSDELEFIKQYMYLEDIRHNHTFQYELKIEDELDCFSITIPPMMIQPFLENAIKYGITTHQKENLITMNIKLVSGFLHIQIEDNGRGIKEVRANNRTRKHQSNAIEIITKRLDLMVNKKGLKGTLKIIDKTDLNPPQKGTFVELKIPITP